MTLQRDQATYRDEVAMQDIHALRDSMERLLVHVLNQRNEDWHEEDVLRAQ
jgi:hypothetical protein